MTISTVRLMLSTAFVLLASIPAQGQLTTKSRPAADPAVRTKACIIDPKAPPLQVPAGEVCACVQDPAGQQTPPSCARPQDELARLVDFGTSRDLMAFLEALAAVAMPPNVPSSTVLRFVWAGTDAEGKPVARDVLYQRGAEAPLDRTLPGVRSTARTLAGDHKYFDVLVLFDLSGEAAASELPGLESFYTSSRRDNPLLEDVPAFVGQLGILEALAAQGGVTLSTLRAGRAVTVGPRATAPRTTIPPPRVVLKVYTPELPYKRAEIAVRDWIVLPASRERLVEDASDLNVELGRSAGRVSPCAKTLSDQYTARITAVVKENSPACAGSLALFSAESIRCRSELNRALDGIFASLVGSNACGADTGSIGSDPVTAVDDAFRALVRGLGAAVVKGESQLTNTPRENFSFGVMTAIRVGNPNFTGVRAKVGDGGNVSEDPLPRLVNSVVVNWHPAGYDSSQLVTWKDPGSVKLFGGTTISPDFGFTAGVAYSPLRGLSFNFGYAALLINAPRTGVTLGEPVPDAFVEDPFKTARARTWVWGLSYSFQ